MTMTKFTRTAALLIRMTAWLQLAPAIAAPSPVAQIEIHDLLSVVGKSGCSFFRNGTWYDSQAAQQHLQKKLDFALAIDSAEQFIDRIATASSFTNQLYQVRCNNAAATPSAVWLRNALARIRAKPL